MLANETLAQARGHRDRHKEIPGRGNKCEGPEPRKWGAGGWECSACPVKCVKFIYLSRLHWVLVATPRILDLHSGIFSCGT